MWPTSSGCLGKDATCTPPWCSPTPPTNSESGCSSASAGVGSPVYLFTCLCERGVPLHIFDQLIVYLSLSTPVRLYTNLSTCLPSQLTCPPVFLLPGIPFPIIVAWAFGKLYYDNEKWVAQLFWSSVLSSGGFNTPVPVWSHMTAAWLFVISINTFQSS